MANTLKFGNGEWYGKKDTILAYNDENSNYKPLPFDFSRASKATVVNKDGLIEEVGSGQPRVDYKDDSKGALKLEPSRTNLLPYSEDFIVSNWTKTRCTVTSNQAVSPDGNLTADLMTATGDDARLEDQVGSSGQQYTQSIYVKSAQSTNVNGQMDFAGLNPVTFTANQQWQRINTTLTDTNQLGRARVRITNNGDALYVWGGQIEAGTYPTSYIPTQGSAVTRLADVCNQTPPSGVIGQTEGTLLVDFIRKPQSNSTTGLFGISSSNNADRVIIWNNFSLNGLGLQIKANGSNISGNQSLGTFDNNENYKIAISYKSGEIKSYVNGNSVLSLSNSFTFANDINTIIVNSYQVGINSELSPFKNLKLYNTALTDEELAKLTS